VDICIDICGSGIPKYIGEAKRATGTKVPIIGICPWGVVDGRQVCA